jgi:hypothetical protein
MRKSFPYYRVLPAATAFTILTLTNCVNTPKTKTAAVTTQPAVANPPVSTPNPLLSAWGGAYGGVPPFQVVEVSQFKPALEAGMVEKQTEIDKITANTAAPNFENTIVALEKTGQTMERVMTIYGIWSSNMNNRIPEGGTGNGTQTGRFLRPDHPERESCLSASKRYTIRRKKPNSRRNSSA